MAAGRLTAFIAALAAATPAAAGDLVILGSTPKQVVVLDVRDPPLRVGDRVSAFAYKLRREWPADVDRRVAMILVRDEIDCAKSQARVLSMVMFDRAANALGPAKDEVTGWEPVAPDSLAKVEQDYLCATDAERARMREVLHGPDITDVLSAFFA